MQVFRIIYAGPGMSGRRTSLANLMKASGTVADPLLIKGEEEHDFIYTKCCQRYQVTATIPIFQSRMYYEDPEAPSLDRRIIRDIDRLCVCDGIIFIIDSQVPRMPHNLEQFENLKRDLASRQFSIDAKPIVFQANKRDLENICSMEWIREHFHTCQCGYVESVATQDIGTIEAIDTLFTLML